jgi:hypothetical protein
LQTSAWLWAFDADVRPPTNASTNCTYPYSESQPQCGYSMGNAVPLNAVAGAATSAAVFGVVCGADADAASTRPGGWRSLIAATLTSSPMFMPAPLLAGTARNGRGYNATRIGAGAITLAGNALISRAVIADPNGQLLTEFAQAVADSSASMLCSAWAGDPDHTFGVPVAFDGTDGNPLPHANATYVGISAPASVVLALVSPPPVAPLPAPFVSSPGLIAVMVVELMVRGAPLSRPPCH